MDLKNLLSPDCMICVRELSPCSGSSQTTMKLGIIVDLLEGRKVLQRHLDRLPLCQFGAKIPRTPEGRRKRGAKHVGT